MIVVIQQENARHAGLRKAFDPSPQGSLCELGCEWGCAGFWRARVAFLGQTRKRYVRFQFQTLAAGLFMILWGMRACRW